MIYNSNRSGKQPDSKCRSVVVRPGTDVRSGSTIDKRTKSTITPSGKKSRHVIEVNGRLKIA